MITEEGGKVASGVVLGLKEQPLALALVVVNVMYLVAGIFLWRDISSAIRADRVHDAEMFRELQTTCQLCRDRLTAPR